MFERPSKRMGVSWKYFTIQMVKRARYEEWSWFNYFLFFSHSQVGRRAFNLKFKLVNLSLSLLTLTLSLLCSWPVCSSRLFTFETWVQASIFVQLWTLRWKRIILILILQVKLIRAITLKKLWRSYVLNKTLLVILLWFES